jgi:hypothetical protein
MRANRANERQESQIGKRVYYEQGGLRASLLRVGVLVVEGVIAM